MPNVPTLQSLLSFANGKHIADKNDEHLLPFAFTDFLGRFKPFLVCLFVCFVALRPKSTAMVIAGRYLFLVCGCVNNYRMVQC